MHDYFDAPFIYGDERYIQDEGKKIIFRSQSDAARSLGLKQSNVWKVLNGQRSHTCGYNFRYLKRNGDRE